MKNETFSQVIALVNQQDPAEFLEVANDRKTWVCPKCGNGTGHHGVGIDPKGRVVDGKIKWHCFSCGMDYDVMDLIGFKFGLVAIRDKMGKARELYPEIFQTSTSSPRGNQVQKTMPAPEEKTKRTPERKKAEAEYIRRCIADADYSYLRTRGISEETQKRFSIGTDKKKNWLVIPYTEDYRVARPMGDIPPNKAKYDFTTGERPCLFNEAVMDSGKPFFVTEGEIDALSIEELGYPAVAMGGAYNTSKTVEAMTKHPLCGLAILFLDADDTGRSNQEALKKMCEERQLLCLPAVFPPHLPFKDANEALINDGYGLNEFLAETYKEAIAIPLREIESYSITSAIEYLEDIENREWPEFKTGFDCFDEEAHHLYGGLHEGLYIVGAVSSFGKTTFCLQLAEQLAQNGYDVIFFSLEQSRLELVSKGVSRRTYQDYPSRKDKGLRKPAMKVMNRNLYPKYSVMEKTAIRQAEKRYKAEEASLYIYEGRYNGNRLTVHSIGEIVNRHVSITGKKPVVFVDYLQIIAPSPDMVSATDKQIVDACVFELKELSRNQQIPVIAISSFNRENYSNSVSMTSFKESGAIEYSSDILIGLQPYGWDSPEGGETEKERAIRLSKVNADVKRRKEEAEPVGVHLKVLKNRNGEWFDAYFEYVHAYNSFREISLEDVKNLCPTYYDVPQKKAKSC